MKKSSLQIALCCLGLAAVSAAALSVYYASHHFFDEKSGSKNTDRQKQTVSSDDMESVDNENSNAQFSPTKDKVKEFLNSDGGQEFQSATEGFINAYLNGDREAMKSYLADPDDVSHDFAMENVPVDCKSYVLKLSENDIKEDMVAAEYEFILTNEDSHTYLNLEMEKIDNMWKVKYFGLKSSP